MIFQLQWLHEILKINLGILLCQSTFCIPRLHSPPSNAMKTQGHLFFCQSSFFIPRLHSLPSDVNEDTESWSWNSILPYLISKSKSNAAQFVLSKFNKLVTHRRKSWLHKKRQKKCAKTTETYCILWFTILVNLPPKWILSHTRNKPKSTKINNRWNTWLIQILSKATTQS